MAHVPLSGTTERGTFNINLSVKLGSAASPGIEATGLESQSHSKPDRNNYFQLASVTSEYARDTARCGHGLFAIVGLKD